MGTFFLGHPVCVYPFQRHIQDQDPSLRVRAGASARHHRLHPEAGGGEAEAGEGRGKY